MRGGAAAQLGAGRSPEPEKPREADRGWGQDINGGHQMQMEGREGEKHRASQPSNAAGASGAEVQTNRHGQKRPDSHSNELPPQP